MRHLSEYFAAFVIIPFLGYAGLWIIASALFLVYFVIFRISIDAAQPVIMIQHLPPILSIATVPLCSFAAFFGATKVVLHKRAVACPQRLVLWFGIDSLVVTIVLDVFVTVIGERIDILIFPINLMYVLAWLVIVPAVMLAGARAGTATTASFSN